MPRLYRLFLVIQKNGVSAVAVAWAVQTRSVGRMAMRRVLTVGVILAASIALAGCVGEAESESSSPSPAASSPESSSEPTTSDDDEALLPMPVEDIEDWAQSAVPGSEDPDYVFGFSGWMSENSSANEVTRFTSLEPGSYQAQLACRGESTITLTASELEEEPTQDPIVCSNETIAFDVTTTRTGVQFELALEGAPTIHAVSLVRVS